MALEIRQALLADGAELAAIDRRTWSTLVGPAPKPPEDRPFFPEGQGHRQVLVAEQGEAIAGWIRLRPPTPLASNAHVREIAGLAVDPDHQRAGVGAALMRAGERLALEGGHGGSPCACSLRIPERSPSTSRSTSSSRAGCGESS